jgi:hypothetical protein
MATPKWIRSGKPKGKSFGWAVGNSPSSIALANLSGSGMDLVVSHSTENTVAVLRGNGDGSFQAAVGLKFRMAGDSPVTESNCGNAPASMVRSRFWRGTPSSVRFQERSKQDS